MKKIIGELVFLIDVSSSMSGIIEIISQNILLLFVSNINIKNLFMHLWSEMSVAILDINNQENLNKFDEIQEYFVECWD